MEISDQALRAGIQDVVDPSKESSSGSGESQDLSE